MLMRRSIHMNPWRNWLNQDSFGANASCGVDDQTIFLAGRVKEPTDRFATAPVDVISLP